MGHMSFVDWEQFVGAYLKGVRENKTQAQIAADLGISTDVLKSRLYDARKVHGLDLPRSIRPHQQLTQQNLAAAKAIYEAWRAEHHARRHR